MADPALPPNLLDDIAELKRRVRTLETANRLESSSIGGSSTIGGSSLLTVLDSTGGQVARLGTLGGTYGNGLHLTDPATNATVLFASDAGGTVVPYLANPWRRFDEYFPVTSATFAETYQCRLESVSSVMIRFTAWLSADASTTGEVRLVVNAAQLGSTVSIAAASIQRYEFSMAHGIVLQGGPVEIAVQARRLTGAGNVNVYEPSGLTLGSKVAHGGAFPEPAGGWHTI